MKKIIILLLVVFAPFIFFTSCEEEDNFGSDAFMNFDSNQSIEKATVTVEGSAENFVSSRFFEEAVNKDGVKYYNSLGWVPIDESVLLKAGATPIDIKFDGGNYRIAPAQLQNGRNVLVSIWYLMPKQKRAVVKAEVTAVVYDGLKPVDSTSYTIPRGTIIGVAPAEPGATRQQFVAFSVKQPVGNPVSFGLWGKYYVASADITTNENDLNMIEAIEKIKKKDKGLWATDVNAAVGAYGDSVFVSDAQALLGNGDGDNSGPRETEEASFSGIINANDVRIRTEPDEKLDNVNNKFEKGIVVQVLSQTKDQFTISGHKARWYYVEGDGKSGWIFGFYLEKAE